MDHYSHYSSFSSALVGFAQEARQYGFKNGIQVSQEMLVTALTGIWLDKDLFEYALTALYCKEEEEQQSFSILYNRFWREKGTRVKSKTNYSNKRNIHKAKASVAVMTGTGQSDSTDVVEESKNTSGANAAEIVKHTDFSKLKLSQSELLDQLSVQLTKEMSLRLKRKKKKSKKGSVDLGRSIRKNIQKGGNIIDLFNTKPKQEKYRLLILLDVSGSMDKYSFYLLKFLWALRIHFKHIEAFAFSTRLMRITEYIDGKDMALTLAKVAQHVTHWSSGTKIGDCLKDFNENYAKRYLNGKTLTIVLSDGLDTGKAEVLETAIQKIKLKSKKLIWLNPLKGMQGYEPIQMGMKTALPALNHFGSAHNFASLMALENILLNA